jgi:hypothetical protein
MCKKERGDKENWLWNRMDGRRSGKRVGFMAEENY